MGERQKFDPSNPPRRRKTVIVAKDLGGYEYEVETVPTYKIMAIYDLVLRVFDFDLSGLKDKEKLMDELRENFNQFPKEFLEAFSLLVDQKVEVVENWDFPNIVDIATEFIMFNYEESAKMVKKKGEAIFPQIKEEKKIKEETQVSEG